MRILLKSLKKTFTSITLVGFIQYLIFGFIFSILIAVIFDIYFLWSGYLFLFTYYFLTRLIMVSKTIYEDKVDTTVPSEEVDKEKTRLLSRVFKKTFPGRIDFLFFLLLAFGLTVQFGFLEIFYIAVPIGLLAIYIMRFVYSFLTDESGFLHPSSRSRLGDSSIDGGGGGEDCGGGGGDCGD